MLEWFVYKGSYCEYLCSPGQSAAADEEYSIEAVGKVPGSGAPGKDENKTRALGS